MAGKAKFVKPEVIELAYLLLCQRTPKYIIRKSVTTFLSLAKPVNYRTFERILSRATERIIEDTGKTRKEMRGEAKAFYEAIIADPATKTPDKLRAQENLDKLYRLSIPERVIISGTGEGGAIKTENKNTVEMLADRVARFDFEALRAAIAKTREADHAGRN